MKSTDHRSELALVALTILAALPAAADTQFRVRRMTRDDVPPGKGQCDIRLQVDDQVEVAVRGEVVSVRTLSGQEARDDGSECNAAFPVLDPREFNFEVKDSRNEINLVESPSRRNGFAVIVRIRDSSGGFGRYHFRLSWALGNTGGFTPTPPSGGPPDFPRDGDRRSGFAWNNATHFGAPGRGNSVLSGFGAQRLSDANVDIDRGGRIQVSFRTNTGHPITFEGTVIDRQGDTIKADVQADDRMLRLRGAMYITIRGREDMVSVRLDASNGRDNLRLNWDRR